MTKLTTLSCVACSGESPLTTPEEVETLRLQVPEWNILISEGVGKLERVFEFSDFIQALEFTNNVGNLAEQENHHPVAGSLRQTRVAARFEGSPPDLPKGAPRLGEHNHEVLCELGLSELEIEHLIKQGAVGNERYSNS